MGFFNKLFGGQKEYPHLDAQSSAARRLDTLREPLETLADQLNDALEVVPGEEKAYVFVGKPPKRFGLAWIEDGEVRNFKNLVEEKGLSQKRLTGLTERLREAYEKSASAQRFSATIGTKNVVVTPSEQLKREVGEVIETATNQ